MRANPMGVYPIVGHPRGNYPIGDHSTADNYSGAYPIGCLLTGGDATQLQL